MNYDVDYASDAIRRKENVVLTVPCPEFISGVARATVLYIDGSTMEAPTSVNNAIITSTIPAVEEAAVIILAPAD